ncbi:MAG: hypothetical protein IJX96_00480 [Clostridia bacterium]|nr:hypothetical protein [Clostridia bacterium]
MAKFKNTIKKIGRQVWELFKSSIPAAIMYFCAGSILMMLTMKENEILWDGGKLAWTLVCAIAAAAYNGLVTYAQGGTAYENLVSGNLKRTSMDDYGGGYRISSHKYAKEYRAWKGFAIGAFIGVYTLIVGIIFGCNQAAIDGQALQSTGMAVVVIVCFLISGWSVLPIYYMNASGMAVSYFLSCLFAIVPVIVTGAFYIIGAYGRRNKAIKAQELADRAAAAEANKVKKINYGGLPGTKPKKRK